ncbi:MAG: hypothetical protein IPN94_12035 [Sphingobacteriales bacterium]|nr:hypothetical protein [Sphingobacteriales bacterium]
MPHLIAQTALVGSWYNLALALAIFISNLAAGAITGIAIARVKTTKMEY